MAENLTAHNIGSKLCFSKEKLHIHVISCQVFGRELSYYSSQSPHVITTSWLPQGLHDTPDILRSEVSREIESLQNKIDEELLKHIPDALVLGYGLCSNGVTGIRSYETPIVIPRTDDCIGVFLGSQKRYLEVFEKYNGTYWLNNGWIETAFIPSPEMLLERKAYYIDNYGEDNGEYLYEMDMAWVKNYKYLGYISSTVYDKPEYEALTADIAGRNNWDYFKLKGDCRMIEMLLNADWPDEEFLVCPPNHKIVETYDNKKFKALPL